MTPNSSRKLHAALLGLAISSIGLSLWLSAAGDSVDPHRSTGAPAAAQDAIAAPSLVGPSTSPLRSPPSASRTTRHRDTDDARSRHTSAVPAVDASTTSADDPFADPFAEPSTAPADPATPGTDTDRHSSNDSTDRGSTHDGTHSNAQPSGHSQTPPTAWGVAQTSRGGHHKRIEGCWSFTYQQDAQAVYEANLSDPYGLDGAKGPFNGDGLACTQLPVDPHRPRSTPAGAYAPPAATVATKAQLVRPATKYFGVAEDGIPGDTKLMNKLSTQVGKAPSMVEWFATWDEDYNATKVNAAWARGALPVISWMPGHKGNKNPADISLQKIVDGDWDSYLLRYAGEVVRDGRPVVLRFAHEMNGNWYPWSAGGNRRFERSDNGNEPFFNTPALFRAAWQHVWTLFDDVGANDDVIWAYTPVSVNGIVPNTTDHSQTNYGMTSIQQDYPGDRYVDWVGMSGYTYKGTGWSFHGTFGKTLAQFQAFAPTKPILIAETGSSENSGPVSNTLRKAFWINDSLTGFAADPQIVGFVWFNNVAVNVHTVNGVKITTDNRWDSSPQALAAFTDAIADPIWASGRAPDSVVTGANALRASPAATSTGRAAR